MEANRDDNMLIYRSADGKIKIDVRFENETVWLTQSQMCVLFGRERSVITKHVKNIFEEKELDENSKVQNFHIFDVTDYDSWVVFSAYLCQRNRDGYYR